MLTEISWETVETIDFWFTGAVVVLARRAVYDWITLAIALVTAVLLFRWKIPEPIVIFAAAVVGLGMHH